MRRRSVGTRILQGAASVQTHPHVVESRANPWVLVDQTAIGIEPALRSPDVRNVVNQRVNFRMNEGFPAAGNHQLVDAVRHEAFQGGDCRDDVNGMAAAGIPAPFTAMVAPVSRMNRDDSRPEGCAIPAPFCRPFQMTPVSVQEFQVLPFYPAMGFQRV